MGILHLCVFDLIWEKHQVNTEDCTQLNHIQIRKRRTHLRHIPTGYLSSPGALRATPIHIQCHSFLLDFR